MAEIRNTKETALSSETARASILGGIEPVRWEGFFRLVREKGNRMHHWWIKYSEAAGSFRRRKKDRNRGVQVQ